MTKIAVLGYGTVGSGVVEVIQTNRDLINQKIGDSLEIKYILDLKEFPGSPIEKLIVHDFEEIVNDEEVKVVVEVMGGVEPAYTFVMKSLLAGKSVATSNKALVAKHGAELLAIAKEKNLNFLFEASVGGGIPIIRPLNTSLSADDIEEITGILNGTTNYMLSKMYHEDADYDEFIGKLKDAANEADTSYSDYLKQMFGKRATEKRVKEFLKDYLKSTAYQEKLTETLAASDSEVSAYYEDNKDTYDKFEYRMFKVKAESSDSSDMANAKETANSFASGVSSELDFINQCRKFAEAGDDTYADDAASLVTETKKSNIEEACADWIASSDRKEGDLTVIEDDDNTCFYIVYYISRSYDGSDDDAIKSTLLNQKYSEYIKKYTDEYSVNVKKRFSYK